MGTGAHCKAGLDPGEMQTLHMGVSFLLFDMLYINQLQVQVD